MKKIKQKFGGDKGISLRNRIMLIFIVVVVFLVSFLSLASFWGTYRTVKRSAIELAYQDVAHIAFNFEQLMGEILELSNIGRESSVREFMNSCKNDYSLNKEILELMEIYENNEYLKNKVSNIILIGKNGNAFDQRSGLIREDDRENFSDIYQTIINNENIPLVFTNAKGDAGAYIGSVIREDATLQPIGVTVFEIRTTAINRVLNLSSMGNDSFVTGKDCFGNLIYNPHNEAIRRDMESNKRNKYIIEQEIEKYQWTIVGDIDLAIIKDAISPIAVTTIFCLVFCVCCAVLLGYFLSLRIILPVRDLIAKVEAASCGDYTQKVAVYGNDELGQLARKFNYMSDRIQNLIEMNKKEQERLAKTELMALQAQINPHFLFNTLETIIWAAEEKDDAQVVFLTSSLSQFFRTGLSCGVEWVNVEQEITHIRSYLDIQSIRYNDILQYEIEIDNHILQCQMLKLTLQPIVENAIYHGIKNKRGGGKICIRGWDDGENLIFEVWDNGMGIQPKTLKRMLDRLEDGTFADLSAGEDGVSGYGIYNVNMRIKLYCGKRYGISLQSEYGEWTSVKILLKKRKLT